MLHHAVEDERTNDARALAAGISITMIAGRGRPLSFDPDDLTSLVEESVAMAVSVAADAASVGLDLPFDPMAVASLLLRALEN